VSFVLYTYIASFKSAVHPVRALKSRALKPEPKNFSWWSRSVKFGFPFNRHSLCGKRVVQIIQWCLDQIVLDPEPKTMRVWSWSWSQKFRCLEPEPEIRVPAPQPCFKVSLSIYLVFGFVGAFWLLLRLIWIVLLMTTWQPWMQSLRQPLQHQIYSICMRSLQLTDAIIVSITVASDLRNLISWINYKIVVRQPSCEMDVTPRKRTKIVTLQQNTS